MLVGQFRTKLRKVNPKLQVYCGDDPTKPAGICFTNHEGEPETICGIPKPEVPEHSIFEEWPEQPGNPQSKMYRRMIARGWRDALKIIVDNHHAEKARVEKVFGVSLITT